MATTYQWVEIVEPGSGRPVYANIESGDCLWQPPPNVQYKPAGDDQWWELLDANTGRAYYYNASTKKTEWVRPASGDIVALAKLQEAQKAMMAKEQEMKQKQEQEARLKQQQLEAAMNQKKQQAAPSNNTSTPVKQATNGGASVSNGGPPAAPGPAPNMTPQPKADISTSAQSTPKLDDLKDDLSTHKRGLFRRKVSLHNMLSWSRDCIPRPMLLNLPKEHRKTPIDMFRMLQQYMGDRNAKGRAPAAIATNILDLCWRVNRLRDELFIQICKQTTHNAKNDSCERGWHLMIVALNFFPPTKMFESYLRGYIARHTDATQGQVGPLAEKAFRRLTRIMETGQRQGAKSPSNEEVANAIQRIEAPSVWGCTLEEAMELQADEMPDLPIPLVVKVLAEAVLSENGEQTEGIFRVPGDSDLVNAIKVKMDKHEPLGPQQGPHSAASALKLWFRELSEPLIPQSLYDRCIEMSNDASGAIAIVEELPSLNKTLVLFITRFLQRIGRPENQPVTKMTYDNLSMVWAPNYLRCPSNDPMVIFNNTKKEMCFVRQLVLHLDTASVTDFLQA
eukprot:TRINITY_DN10247_c0_g1_i2.p1 TRINITY_DN10247_c0_g1~~TRINITY_DN10247_c0_g1_i2.p1  ORF type:complete len:564 (+),score=131.42 TRINITY_DN10247_c0_g1_i2:123-1814(+)